MGEGEHISLVRQVFLRGLAGKGGVQGDHGHVPLVGLVQLVEVGQLLYAGRAIGRPEVDERDLPPLVRQVERAAVQAGHREVRQLLAHLVAHRRVAGVARRRRGRRFFGGLGRLGTHGLGGRFRRLGGALVGLLVQGLEKLRRHGTRLVVNGLALAVQHHRLGHRARAARQLHHAAVGVVGEWEHVPLVRQEFLRVLAGEGGVQGDHGHVPLVGLVQLVEVGQLLYAGRAIGRPEVDERDLPPLVRQVERAAVQAGHREVRQLLAHLVAHRRVAGVAGCRGDRRLGGGLGRLSGRGLGGRLGCRGGLVIGRRSGRRGCSGRSRRALAGGGLQHIDPQQHRAQRDDRHGPEGAAQLFALLGCVGAIARAALLGGLQRDLPGLDRNRALVAGCHALAAVDALVVAHVANVHATAAHAGAAVVAAILVHLHANDVELIEQAVDRAQRADEPAEGAVAEYTRKADYQHDDELAGEQYAKHTEIGAVRWIGQQPHRALEGACRADVFAEARQRYAVAQGIPQRYGHREHRQQQVFQPGQHPRYIALLDLRRGDLVEQLLDQPQRAQPATDGAAQDHAVQHDDAQHIPTRAMVRGGQRVLDGAQGTGPCRGGTGIAVEAWGAEEFPVALVDFAGNEALYVSIVQQGGIKLDQPAGRRLMGLPPAGFLLLNIIRIIQGQHTPYIS